MRTRSWLVLPLLLLGEVACGGGDDPASPPAFETIGGSYAGVMGGVSQGVAADLQFALTIAQSGGGLTGTYSLNGVLSDGVDAVNVQGTGDLTGTIASGNNPSVNITIRSGLCPNYRANFSGAYDSTNRRLTISGPVEFFNASCQVVLSYPTTLILNR